MLLINFLYFVSEGYRRMKQEGKVGKESDGSFMLSSNCYQQTMCGATDNELFDDTLYDVI